jgi:hypothetical protein
LRDCKGPGGGGKLDLSLGLAAQFDLEVLQEVVEFDFIIFEVGKLELTENHVARGKPLESKDNLYGF